MISKIGFMQGRLCNQVDGKIQAFPWQDWETEFLLASDLSISLMEWTLDQDRLYENPLMTAAGQARIRQLCHQYGVTIPSLTGDCFMQAPFWKTAGGFPSHLSRLCNSWHSDGCGAFGRQWPPGNG
jgi:L-ribulose-5-phosphate 3-epimerase